MSFNLRTGISHKAIMSVGVMAKSMALGNHFTHKTWLGLRHATDIEESCLDAFIGKRLQNTRCHSSNWAVVESQYNFLVAQTERFFMTNNRPKLRRADFHGAACAEFIWSAISRSN